MLGALGELVYESKTALPMGFAPKYSDKVDLVEDFADYHASYSIELGVLTANRRLVIKKSEVPQAEWEKYKKFRKALADERDRYIDLTAGTTVYPPGEGPDNVEAAPANAEANRRQREEAMAEAASRNPEAAELMRDGADAERRRDYTGALERFRKVNAMDPTFLVSTPRLAGCITSRII